MAKKSGLGSSFTSLFEDNMTIGSSNQTLRISEIEPNKNQPRKSFDKEPLETLADSIRTNGVLQPLLVRPLSNGNYQIVAGERRWRASKIAGLDEVPVIIREFSDQETKQIALIENLQRENLNPLEEAFGYKDLIDSFNMTQDDVAKVVNKSRSAITNSLRLLNLPETIKRLLTDGQLSVGHCKALLAIEDTDLMISLANKAAEGDLTVRAIERIVKASKTENIKPIPKKESYFTEVELSLSESIGRKVTVKSGKNKGVLEIEFYDKDELSRMAKILSTEKFEERKNKNKK